MCLLVFFWVHAGACYCDLGLLLSAEGCGVSSVSGAVVGTRGIQNTCPDILKKVAAVAAAETFRSLFSPYVADPAVDSQQEQS